MREGMNMAPPAAPDRVRLKARAPVKVVACPSNTLMPLALASPAAQLRVPLLAVYSVPAWAVLSAVA